MWLLTARWEKKSQTQIVECSGREGQLSGKGDALKSLIKWAYVLDFALLGKFSNSRLQLDVGRVWLWN